MSLIRVFAFQYNIASEFFFKILRNKFKIYGIPSNVVNKFKVKNLPKDYVFEIYR